MKFRHLFILSSPVRLKNFHHWNDWILYANYKEHSFRAAYIHNERQLKSAGSFVYAPSFVYNNVKSNYSLIPDQYQNDYSVKINEQVKAGKFFTFGLSAGYSYTYVFRKYYYLEPALILQK